MYDNLVKRISKKFGRDLTLNEVKYVVDWKEQYGMFDNIIVEAVDRAIKKKTTDISFSYIDAIIKQWHKMGVKTYMDITKADEEYFKNNISAKKELLKENSSINERHIDKRHTKVKNFVLDTNILIHNPYCLFKFENNNLYITAPVLEELDNLSKDRKNPERALSAREARRLLQELRKKGKLIDGVEVNEDGGKVFETLTPPDLAYLPVSWDKNKMDNLILATLLRLRDTTNQDYILVSNDGYMQLKADALNINVEEYKNDRISNDVDVYKGYTTAYIEDKTFSDFCKEHHVEITGKSIWNEYGEEITLTDNEYLILKNSNNGSYLAKYFGGEILSLQYYKRDNKENEITNSVMGIEPRNVKQQFLLNSLMTPYDDIPLTIVNGPAGTGKTLLAIACGLEQVMERKIYKKVLVSRSNIMMDEEIGFLPGGEMDKISPLLRGVYDNIDIIFGNSDDTPAMMEDKRRELFQRGYLDAQSLAYLRGSSIANTFFIIDEAQNCTPRQIFSIISRVSIGTKIVLLGDVNQVDNMRLDSRNNGLIYAINKMKGSANTDIITFEEKDCVRSPLAKEASERLKLD